MTHEVSNTKPPVTNLLIRVSKSDFYQGFSKNVTITAKLLVGALILWAIAFPENAAFVLGKLNALIMAGFNYWYILFWGGRPCTGCGGLIIAGGLSAI